MLGSANFFFESYAKAAEAFSLCKTRIIKSGNPLNSNNRFHIQGFERGYKITFDGGFGAGNTELIHDCHEICKKMQS